MFQRLRQKDLKFKASVSYPVKSSLQESRKVNTLKAIICDKEVETSFKVKADQGNISIANPFHFNAVFNNNYLHNLMAKEY